MMKAVVFYLSSFLVLFVLFYVLHANVFVNLAKASPIQLEALYGFHCAFTLLLTLGLALLHFSNKLEGQLGFLYLASMVFKIILFCLVFKNHIFNTQSFTNTESANLLIPMFLALLFEILFLSKLLNKWSASKND